MERGVLILVSLIWSVDVIQSQRSFFSRDLVPRMQPNSSPPVRRPAPSSLHSFNSKQRIDAPPAIPRRKPLSDSREIGSERDLPPRFRSVSSGQHRRPVSSKSFPGKAPELPNQYPKRVAPDESSDEKGERKELGENGHGSSQIIIHTSISIDPVKDSKAHRKLELENKNSDKKDARTIQPQLELERNLNPSAKPFPPWKTEDNDRLTGDLNEDKTHRNGDTAHIEQQELELENKNADENDAHAIQPQLELEQNLNPSAKPFPPWKTEDNDRLTGDLNEDKTHRNGDSARRQQQELELENKNSNKKDVRVIQPQLELERNLNPSVKPFPPWKTEGNDRITGTQNGVKTHRSSDSARRQQQELELENKNSGEKDARAIQPQLELERNLNPSAKPFPPWQTEDDRKTSTRNEGKTDSNDGTRDQQQELELERNSNLSNKPFPPWESEKDGNAGHLNGNHTRHELELQLEADDNVRKEEGRQNLELQLEGRNKKPRSRGNVRAELELESRLTKAQSRSDRERTELELERNLAKLSRSTSSSSSAATTTEPTRRTSPTTHAAEKASTEDSKKTEKKSPKIEPFKFPELPKRKHETEKSILQIIGFPWSKKRCKVPNAHFYYPRLCSPPKKKTTKKKVEEKKGGNKAQQYVPLYYGVQPLYASPPQQGFGPRHDERPPKFLTRPFFYRAMVRNIERDRLKEEYRKQLQAQQEYYERLQKQYQKRQNLTSTSHGPPKQPSIVRQTQRGRQNQQINQPNHRMQPKNSFPGSPRHSSYQQQHLRLGTNQNWQQASHQPIGIRRRPEHISGVGPLEDRYSISPLENRLSVLGPNTLRTRPFHDRPLKTSETKVKTDTRNSTSSSEFFQDFMSKMESPEKVTVGTTQKAHKATTIKPATTKKKETTKAKKEETATLHPLSNPYVLAKYQRYLATRGTHPLIRRFFEALNWVNSVRDLEDIFGKKFCEQHIC